MGENNEDPDLNELELHRRLFDLVFRNSGSPYSKEAQELRDQIMEIQNG